MNGNNKDTSTNKEKKSKGKLIVNILLYVFLGLLLAFDGFALYSRFSMKGTGGAMSLFGSEVRIVLTGSMVGTDEFYEQHPDYEIKRIDIHDAVFVKTAPAADAAQSKIDDFYKDIKVGDILTFIDQSHNMKVVSHRIIEVHNKINPENGNLVYTYKLLGDNPEAQDDKPQDATSDSGNILGRVTGKNKGLGRFLYSFVGNKIVIVFTVIVPCALFAVYEIIKIIIIVNKSRVEKAKEGIDAKEDEIQRLKSELERMKKENDSKEDK